MQIDETTTYRAGAAIEGTGGRRRVVSSNITGAAAVAVDGAAELDLTMTGAVTNLTLTGWDSTVGLVQEVLVTLRQDATGGHAFDWGALPGAWIEDPPTNLLTDPEAISMQVRVRTNDGGATVEYEPIGVTYALAADCIGLKSIEVAVPATADGGRAVILHSFASVAAVSLRRVADNKMIYPEWFWATNSVEIVFSPGIADNEFVAVVIGSESEPCQLVGSTGRFTIAPVVWEEITLQVNGATRMRPTFVHSGGAGQVELIPEPGVTIPVTSGVVQDHTYGFAYSGPVTLRWQQGVVVTEFIESVNTAEWSFDVAVLPTTLTSLRLPVRNTISGDVNSLPAGLTTLNLQGQTTLSGNVAAFPAGITTITVGGSNTITGDISTISTAVDVFVVSGNNTLSGDIAGLHNGILNFRVQGSNTVTGDISTLPTAVDVFELSGNNSVTGDIAALPTSITNLRVDGFNTISGDIGTMPTSITSFIVSGNNVLAGDLAGLHTGLAIFDVQGDNTIIGNIANIPSSVRWFVLFGDNSLSLTGTWTPSPSMRTFNHQPTTTGLTAAEVDNVLVALDGIGNSNGTVRLLAANPPRTTASDAAVASLQGRSWNVFTN